MADKKQQELSEMARKWLFEGEFRRAEYALWEIVRAAPRAPTATYLLGLTILAQRRFADSRPLIDRAYELRLWVDDRMVMPFTVELLTDAAAELPEWEWPRYQLARERWRSVGLSVKAAVERLANEKQGPVSFVQIGANDGRSGDPLHKLVRKHGLRGLLVEPQPEPYARLKANYAEVEGLRFENAAVGPKDAPIDMVTTSDRSTIGSILPDRNILKLRGDDELKTIRVDGLTFDSLMKKHDIGQFDLLQIDTEGYDYRVLQQVDLREHDVVVVNLEFYCLPVSERLAACDQLDEAGFAWDFGKMDLVAVKRGAFDEAFCITEMNPVPVTPEASTPS